MESSIRQIADTSKKMTSVILLLGIVLMVGTWGVLYWVESLFTESHLVGYYCCVTEQDLPARGTLERTLSDFFRASPGKHSLSLIFVSANAALFFKGVARVRKHFWLPLLFVVFSFLYLVVDFWLVGVSWSISDSINGPLTSAYKGYYRTQYGIVLHLALWGLYFAVIAIVISIMGAVGSRGTGGQEAGPSAA